MRLFFALDLPPRAKDAVGSLMEDIEGVRWMAPDNLHVTLQFIGDVSADAGRTLLLADPLIETLGFTVRLCGTGCFPDERRPSVLWIGIEPEEDLVGLKASIASAAHRTLVPFGIALETRPFVPHLTIARVRRGARPDLRAWLERTSGFATDAMEVRSFHLYSSELRRSGAVYRALRTYALK